jgi:Toastrack DUF4097
MTTSARSGAGVAGHGDHPSGDRERRESFTAAGPVKVRAYSRSGDVSVQASDGVALEVTLRAASPAAAHVLEGAIIRFDPATSELDVRTRAKDGVDSMWRLKDILQRRAWSELRLDDLDVQVTVPVGSSVEIMTASGDSKVSGELVGVSVSSASGDVDIEDAVDELDVRTASGDVKSGGARRSLQCVSASGDVRVTGTAAATTIKTASGDVHVFADAQGDVTIRTVSGNVSADVAKGMVVDVDASSVSGALTSTIALDSGQKRDRHGDGELTLNVRTVSGDLRLRSAEP